MNLKTLRRIIREEVENALSEVEKAGPMPPNSFQEFRKRTASSLKASGAPKQIVAKASAVDDEAGSVASVLFDAWRNIEIKFNNAPKEDKSKK